MFLGDVYSSLESSKYFNPRYLYIRRNIRLCMKMFAGYSANLIFAIRSPWIPMHAFILILYQQSFYFGPTLQSHCLRYCSEVPLFLPAKFFAFNQPEMIIFKELLHGSYTLCQFLLPRISTGCCSSLSCRQFLSFNWIVFKSSCSFISRIHEFADVLDYQDHIFFPLFYDHKQCCSLNGIATTQGVHLHDSFPSHISGWLLECNSFIYLLFLLCLPSDFKWL